MNNLVKHANSNPSLWINIGCLVSALVMTAMKDDLVKQYPVVIISLGIVNFSITSVLQYLRDLKHGPINTVDDSQMSGNNTDSK